MIDSRHLATRLWSIEFDDEEDEEDARARGPNEIQYMVPYTYGDQSI